MAKADGIIEIQGTVKGVTFYRSKDGQLVRAKGGIPKKRIQNDPAFQRTRENGAEFAHSAKMGQLLRMAAADMLSLAKDHRVSSRLLQRMSQVKNLDATNDRGQRSVAVGLATEEGKAVLRGFDFNQRSRFASVFRNQYVLDPATGAVSITDFNPMLHLSLPTGATHVSFSTAMSTVNLESGAYETRHGIRENFVADETVQDFTLASNAVPTGTGFTFFFFLIEFFQEINGTQYPLKNNAHNVLYLMEVV